MSEKNEKRLTVGDLRAAIADLPDDLLVGIESWDPLGELVDRLAPAYYHDDLSSQRYLSGWAWRAEIKEFDDAWGDRRKILVVGHRT